LQQVWLAQHLQKLKVAQQALVQAVQQQAQQ
jgi:hypothetical protein